MNKLRIAKLYATAHGHRIAQNVKKTAHDASEEITSQNMKELGIATAVLCGVALTARVAGFKAGYAHANKNAI